MSGWASGIAFDGKQLRATIHVPGGETRGVALVDLARMGVPAFGRMKRSLTASLRDWTRADAAEYLMAAGFARPARNIHCVYTYQTRREALVVPALAFMRAFFRPPRIVLPAMFHPQGLDRLVVPSSTDLNGAVDWHVGLRSDGTKLTRASMRNPLSWMHSFPTARAMCDSVHGAARSGAIDLELPRATAKLVCRGQKHGRLFLVSELSIVHLVATESPFPYAANHPGRVAFHAGAREHPATTPSFASTTTRALSTREWEEVAPVLAARSPRHVHSDRELFAVALTRYATGVRWREVPCSPKVLASAQMAYSRWRRRKVWDHAIATLERLRGDAAGARTPDAEDSEQRG